MKIGLVYSFEESDWFSVTKIVQNLLASYQRAYGEDQLELINYSVKNSAATNEASAKKAAELGLDKLVFLDHKPHPVMFLEWLGAQGLDKVNEIVFHVFGDFTLTLSQWKRSESLLKGRKVKFICASDKEAKLVKKFCANGNEVFVSPFPVDDEQFKFSDKNKKEIRNKLGFGQEDKLFFYVGRMSQQKNTLELAQTFLELKQEGSLGSDCKLLLAGGYDLIGMPYLQQPHSLGEYFRKTEKALADFPKELRKDLVFLGNIPNKELCDYYNCVDRLVSFSTYHDEDYGMAVAEALCSGLPALLTDWAGYSSFRSTLVPEATIFIKTHLGERAPGFDKNEARNMFIKTYRENVSPEERKEIAAAFRSQLSIGYCSENLKRIMEREPIFFDGYSELMNRMGAVALFRPYPFMDEMTKCFNDFYFKVYDVYAE